MKKKIVVAAAVGALTLAASQAFAFENEFHGMFKFMAYESDWLSGGTATTGFLQKDAKSGFYAEQRARLQYIAKANDDLKLVTHFELDTRFGGVAPAYKGTASGNDAGQLDADSLTLETKSIYLDTNCPITGTNFKVGLQPWADAYKSLFLLADMTGVYASKKVIDPLTISLGWFRYNDKTDVAIKRIGNQTQDLIVLDTKFAPTKDITAGFTYYNTQRHGNIATYGPSADLLHMVGLNAKVTAGPATIEPFIAYQFGQAATATPTANETSKISAMLAGAVAKVKVGPGAINASAIYLSGDKDGIGTNKDFKPVGPGTSYFNPANMWILVRNGQQTNTSTSITQADNTVGGRGLYGVFAGYEAAIGKLFLNANAGYAMTAESRRTAGGWEKKSIGTEVNAQVGYKLYENLTASIAGAYAILGEGMKTNQANDRIQVYAVDSAANPWLTNVQLSYAF